MKYTDFYKMRFTSSEVVTHHSFNEGIFDPLPTDVRKVFPIDSYGRCADLLSQYFSTTDTLQQQRILSMLDSTNVGKSTFASLPDKVKLQLLKPRQLQEPSELKAFTDYVRNVLDGQLSAPEHQPEPAPSDSPSEPSPSSTDNG